MDRQLHAWSGCDRYGAAKTVPYALSNFTESDSASAVAITDTAGTHGGVLGGMTSSSLSGHLSTAVEGGITHLFIS